MQTFKFVALFLLLMTQNSNSELQLLELDIKTLKNIIKEGKIIKITPETDIPLGNQFEEEEEEDEMHNKKVISKCLDYEVKYFKIMVEIEEIVDYLLSKDLQWKNSLLQMLKDQRRLKSEAERLIFELDKLSNSKTLDEDQLIKLQNEKDKIFEDNVKIQKQTKENITDLDLILKVRQELNGLIPKHKSMGSKILSNGIFLEDELGIKRLYAAKPEVQDLYVKRNDFDIKVLEQLSEAYKEVEKLKAAINVEVDKVQRNKLKMQSFFLINEKIPNLITEDLYLKYDGELIFRAVAADKKHKKIGDLLEEISDLLMYYDRGEAKVEFLSEQFEELMFDADMKLDKYEKTEL